MGQEAAKISLAMQVNVKADDVEKVKLKIFR